MTKITVNTDLCIGCGQCTKDCIWAIPTVIDKKVVIPEERKTECFSCGHCAATCPTGAITLYNQPAQPIPQDDSMISIMKRRRGIRQYKTDLIPESEIREMLNFTKYSASGCNFRPIKFLVLSGEKFKEWVAFGIKKCVESNDPSIPADFKKMCEQPGMDLFITRGSPHAVFAYGTTDTKFGEYAFDDAVIQLTHFELIASQRGYGTLWSAMLKKLMNVPGVMEFVGLKDVKCYHALNLGIPAVKFHHLPPREDVDVTFI